MRKRNVKFQYFVPIRQIYNGEKWKGQGKFDIDTWIDKIDKENLKNATIDLGDVKASIDKIEYDEKDDAWTFRFMKLREDNIPSIVKENQEAEAIILDSDEYIGEGLHMLYDNTAGIAMLQVNRFSLGIKRLEEFLSVTWNEKNERIRLIPLMDTQIFNTKKRRYYRAIEIGFANISPQLDEGKNSLSTIMNLYRKFQGVSGSIKISVGRKRNSTLNIDEAKEIMNDAIQDNTVDTLKLHVKDDDDRPVEVIDLFDKIAKDVLTFNMQEKKALEYSYVIMMMKKCYREKKEYLQNLIKL